MAFSPLRCGHDEQPPLGYTYNITAFDILADLGKVQTRVKDLDKTDPKQRHRKPLDAMLKHSRKPRILSAPEATTAAVAALVPALPNNHFGWVCIDEANTRLIVCFRGTEYFKDWLDDFDFAPAPYSAIPGRGRFTRDSRLSTRQCGIMFAPS
jgi:hypothetical protein